MMDSLLTRMKCKLRILRKKNWVFFSPHQVSSNYVAYFKCPSFLLATLTVIYSLIESLVLLFNRYQHRLGSLFYKLQGFCPREFLVNPEKT